MTALAAIRENDRKDGVILAIPMIAAEIIYKGSTAILDATSKLAKTNDGTTVTLSADDVFAGVAVETVDNSGGAASDKQVRLFQTGDLLFNFPSGDAIGQDDVGKNVYINNVSDDGEVTITLDGGGVDLQIGFIVAVGDDAHTAYVRIDNAIGNVAA